MFVHLRLPLRCTALQMLPKFEIGTLVSREFVPYKADESGFYREMCKRVGQASRGRSTPFSVLCLGRPKLGLCSVGVQSTSAGAKS